MCLLPSCSIVTVLSSGPLSRPLLIFAWSRHGSDALFLFSRPKQSVCPSLLGIMWWLSIGLLGKPTLLWTLWVVCTESSWNSHLPYSGFISREKTFMSCLKIYFDRENFHGFAETQFATPTNMSYKSKNGIRTRDNEWVTELRSEVHNLRLPALLLLYLRLRFGNEVVMHPTLGD